MNDSKLKELLKIYEEASKCILCKNSVEEVQKKEPMMALLIFLMKKICI